MLRIKKGERLLLPDAPRALLRKLTRGVMKRTTGMDGFARGGVLPRRQGDDHGEEIYTVM